MFFSIQDNQKLFQAYRKKNVTQASHFGPVYSFRTQSESYLNQQALHALNQQRESTLHYTPAENEGGKEKHRRHILWNTSNSVQIN